jgi:hypothetical protein
MAATATNSFQESILSYLAGRAPLTAREIKDALGGRGDFDRAFARLIDCRRVKTVGMGPTDPASGASGPYLFSL